MQKSAVLNQENIKTTIGVLREYFGTTVSCGTQDREKHTKKIENLTGIAVTLDAIIYPKTTAETQQIISICQNKSTPFICFPQAEFSINPISKPWPYICLNLTRLNQIISIDSKRHTATVEFGVSIQELNQAINHHRLYFKSEMQKDTYIGLIAQQARTELINHCTDFKISNVISTVNLNNNGEIKEFIPTYTDLNCITEVTVKLDNFS